MAAQEFEKLTLAKPEEIGWWLLTEMDECENRPPADLISAKARPGDSGPRCLICIPECRTDVTANAPRRGDLRQAFLRWVIVRINQFEVRPCFVHHVSALCQIRRQFPESSTTSAVV
jgi:hypothetical protein